MSRDITCPGCAKEFYAIGADWTPSFITRCQGCNENVVVPKHRDPWMLKYAAQSVDPIGDRVVMEISQEEALLVESRRKNPGPSLLERIGMAVAPLTWKGIDLFACPLCLQFSKDMEGDWHAEDCLIAERDRAQNAKVQS